MSSPGQESKKKSTKTGKHPGGRPSKYTIAIGEDICSQIADNKSLRTICAQDGMPDPSTIIRWLARKGKEYEEFRTQYAHSRELQADTIYEDIISIEADLRAGVIDAPTARVLIDSHKWRAGKMRPKVYGDKSYLEHTSKDGAPLIPDKIEWVVVHKNE